MYQKVQNIRGGGGWTTNPVKPLFFAMLNALIVLILALYVQMYKNVWDLSVHSHTCAGRPIYRDLDLSFRTARNNL